jgi:hypothetical protein
MFEKEAEEYFKTECLHSYADTEEQLKEDVVPAFQKGAEFGYNKANEWHYMKDVNCYEDLPQNKDVYYAYVVNVGAYDNPTIERKLGCFAEFEYDVMAYHVIAWKEIVLPELKESE